YRDSVFVDEERVFVGAVGGPAILDDAEPSRRYLLRGTMVEQDDAVRNVFFESLPRQGPLAPFSGYDRRHTFVLQPAKQPAKLGTKKRLVHEACEKRFDGVQHHSLRADGADCQVKPDKQAFQVITVHLFYFLTLHPNVIDDEHVARLQRFEIMA